MGIFKRAHVRGINFELTRQGLLEWPSEKIADEVADAVADNLEGDELDEITADEGLTADEATNVISQLVDVAQEIAEKTSGIVDRNFNKLAASVDPQEAASLHAINLMEKAAAESEGGTDVTGDGRFQDEIMGGGLGDTDAENNPSSDKVAPIGTTELDTSAGAVGAEKPQDEPPGPTALTQGEVAKISALLQKLSEGTATGTSPGSGDTGSTAYTEPNTNMAANEAITQGKTTMDKGPLIGDQKPNPAMENAVSVPSEVAKLSSLLTRALNKLSEEEEEEEEKEEKEEEKEDEDNDDTEVAESDKQASELLSALRTVVKYIPTK